MESQDIVIFDFDRTLTTTDTTFAFLWLCSSKCSVSLRHAKAIVWYVIAILVKLRVVSNEYHRSVGVRLFLKGLSRQQLISCAADYARTVNFSKVYRENFLDKKNPWVVTGSLEEYVRILFPEAVVLGSVIKYDTRGVVENLEFNCQGANKLLAVQARGINQVKELYTDNQSDGPLMSISKVIYIVKNGMIKKKYFNG